MATVLYISASIIVSLVCTNDDFVTTSSGNSSTGNVSESTDLINTTITSILPSNVPSDETSLITFNNSAVSSSSMPQTSLEAESNRASVADLTTFSSYTNQRTIYTSVNGGDESTQISTSMNMLSSSISHTIPQDTTSIPPIRASYQQSHFPTINTASAQFSTHTLTTPLIIGSSTVSSVTSSRSADHSQTLTSLESSYSTKVPATATMVTATNSILTNQMIKPSSSSTSTTSSITVVSSLVSDSTRSVGISTTNVKSTRFSFEQILLITFTDEDWMEEYRNASSNLFIDKAADIQKRLRDVLGTMNVESVTVLELRPGSIIANTSIIFTKYVSPCNISGYIESHYIGVQVNHACTVAPWQLPNWMVTLIAVLCAIMIIIGVIMVISFFTWRHRCKTHGIYDVELCEKKNGWEYPYRYMVHQKSRL